ncbi:hypothetical protein MRB53_038063 [Persea americana]|nr:hypothetical protein MRB53_038063 [Persea americana]
MTVIMMHAMPGRWASSSHLIVDGGSAGRGLRFAKQPCDAVQAPNHCLRSTGAPRLPCSVAARRALRSSWPPKRLGPSW